LVFAELRYPQGCLLIAKRFLERNGETIDKQANHLHIEQATGT